MTIVTVRASKQFGDEHLLARIRNVGYNDGQDLVLAHDELRVFVHLLAASAPNNSGNLLIGGPNGIPIPIKTVGNQVPFFMIDFRLEDEPDIVQGEFWKASFTGDNITVVSVETLCRCKEQVPLFRRQ